MRRLTALLFFVFFFVAAQLAAERPAIPTLTIEGDDGKVALEMTNLDIRVTIRGHLARTEYAMTFHNSLDRVAAGDFRFPLPADAEVSDLGLYFDDHLRHGVAVERVLARAAYEAVVHRGVDPALVEWSAGRGFRLRVYPIPEKGEKKVFIAYDQELIGNDYVLDLRYGRTMHFALAIDADGRTVDIEGTLPRSARGQAERVDGILRVARDARETAFAAHSPEDNAWYASAAVDLVSPSDTVTPAPHVVILYDTSSSSVQQNAARIRSFLAAFLSRQQAWAKADVIPFHIALDRARRIEGAATAAGQRELDRVLAEQQPLGATNLLAVVTQLPAIAASLPPATRIVLVTDGLTSLGDSRDVAAAFAKLADLRRPLLVVNAANTADDQLLRNAARATGGWSFDLMRTDPGAAAETAMRLPAEVQTGGGVVPRSVLIAGEARIAVAVRAQASLTTLTVARRELRLRELHDARETSMVRRAWARARLREMLESLATDEELIAHGRAYTQLTPRTSLLVLESWRDYEQYGIPMPPDVVAEKQRDEEQRKAVLRPLQLPPTVVTQGGWSLKGRVLESSGNPLPGVTVRLQDGGVTTAADVTDADGRFLLAQATPPKDVVVLAQLEGFNVASRKLADDAPSGASLDLVMQIASISEAITVTAEAPVVETSSMAAASSVPSLRTQVITTDNLLTTIARDAVTDSDDPEVRAAVALQRRDLTREVIARLRAITSTNERLRYYLSARAFLGGDKSFHVFAAEVFRDRSPEVAARVLSDLAEARHDDAPLLRILARVLDGWNEPDLARLLLRRAIELSPAEPQSWREMILLEARHGRPAEVASWTRRLQATRRDDREIEEIYAQVDDAAARWTRASAFDRQRGVDIRFDPADDITVELMFDTGWSWVDLHITEPSGETVTWNHTASAAGATFTGGMIFGFGPEIYRIRNAPRGDYRVDIDYYASDDTNVSLETLAHVVVYSRGRRGAIERREHFVVLSIDEEYRTLTTVRKE